MSDFMCKKAHSGRIGSCVYCERDEALRRILDLERWKNEQLEVESTWNPQAVAGLLGIGLGQNIRPNIQPKIVALLARVAELEKDKERLDWLHSHWGRFIACAGPDRAGYRLRDAVDMAMKGDSK